MPMLRRKYPQQAQKTLFLTETSKAETAHSAYQDARLAL